MAWKILIVTVGLLGCLVSCSASRNVPRTAEVEQDDTAVQLARTINTLAEENARLKEEVRQLREENDRLRGQSARGSAQVPSKTGKSTARERFRDHGDYVEDTRTGLLWQKDGDVSGKLNYYDAIKYATSLQLGGIFGWRVPTKDELASIFPAVEAPFTDTKYTKEPVGKGSYEWNSYWTSNVDARLPDYAYVFHWYADGGANNCSASMNYVYVRCVRDPIKP